MRRPRLWVIAALLVAVTVIVAALLGGPSPPRRITLATGQRGGSYDTFGGLYAARLGRVGLRTDVVQSSGSVDNLHRLLRGEVDVAFAQSGTSSFVADPRSRLRAIAAIYLEPLWVFYQKGISVRSLSDLADRRFSVGLAGSGTEAVATLLLREHGIDAAQPTVVRLANPAAQEQLERDTLQAAFFVTSYRDALVRDLLARPNIRLFSFHRDAVYTRKFPALTTVRIPEGLLDLRRNIPPADTTLLAPAAMLACRADLHPRVVEQILKVAQSIHSSGSLIDPPLRFPSREGVDLPLHEAADIYLTQGESFPSRTLPYGLLRWTPLLRVLLVSLIVWIPVVRFLPEVLSWRVKRRFIGLYGALRQAERGLEAAHDANELRARLADLDRLAREARPLCNKLPAGRQHDVYNWRVHVAFVRAQAAARLATLEAETTRGQR